MIPKKLNYRFLIALIVTFLFQINPSIAKENLTLSYAVSRFRWGNLIQCEPSRFLEELDPKYIEHTFSRKKSFEPFKNSFSKSSTKPLTNKFSKPLAHLKKVSNTEIFFFFF